jgi:hypothetical protein
MENAYYYFFSATPQVLAGIIALFGVFVLFKLQALSNELSPIANNLHYSLDLHLKMRILIPKKLGQLCQNSA